MTSATLEEGESDDGGGGGDGGDGDNDDGDNDDSDDSDDDDSDDDDSDDDDDDDDSPFGQTADMPPRHKALVSGTPPLAATCIPATAPQPCDLLGFLPRLDPAAFACQVTKTKVFSKPWPS